MVDPTGHPVPAVLRSRRELESRGVMVLGPDAVEPTQLPLLEDGSTYSMAQEARWLDDRHFAVGRWDGSLSIFAFAEDPNEGPVISAAASDPASEGVQMICPLGSGAFTTSSGDAALTVWAATNDAWQDVHPTAYPYGPALGAANSAALILRGGVLVVGHASGLLSMWEVNEGRWLSLRGTVDVRNPRPVNPWGLHNLRGVAEVGDGIVVCGSEDGLLSVVDARSESIVSQTLYNPHAQRGVNAIALSGSGELLVANCAVGRQDRNLWYYTLTAQEPRPVVRASVNLRVQPTAPQVFNFSTIWAATPDGPCFFASTEEGALWMGTVDRENGDLSVTGYARVTTPLGSALAYRPGGQLVLASYDLYEFRTGA